MVDIVCCPHCKRQVEAKFYMGNLALVAALESVLPTINCPCGYYGLPIKLKIEEYARWIKA